MHNSCGCLPCIFSCLNIWIPRSLQYRESGLGKYSAAYSPSLFFLFARLEDSFFDFLRFHSTLWNVKAGSAFFFFSLHSSFFFLLFLSLFLSLLPFSSREEDFIEPRHFLRVISYCHGSSCRTIKRWTERNGETPFSFSRAKRREEGGGREREEKKVIKRIGEKFASSSDNTRFRQPTVDYFYARTQLFIVQRIIRSIRPLRHSHYEN